MKGMETTPGVWITDLETEVRSARWYRGVAVYLYASGAWKCEACGSLQEPTVYCPHLEAVLNSNPTRCADPEHPGCHEIACGDYRIDGVRVPLCPEHATALEKSVA